MYKKAIASQKEYVQLGHICYWDLSLAYLALGDWANAYESLHILGTESNWSKAIYTYGQAIALLEQGKDTKTAGEMMERVPGLTQKIAGKSIPLEVSTFLTLVTTILTIRLTLIGRGAEICGAAGEEV